MNSFFKGMAAGVIVGATSAVIAVVMLPKNSRNRHGVKQNTEKALKAVGALIENVQAMIG